MIVLMLVWLIYACLGISVGRLSDGPVEVSALERVTEGGRSLLYDPCQVNLPRLHMHVPLDFLRCLFLEPLLLQYPSGCAFRSNLTWEVFGEVPGVLQEGFFFDMSKKKFCFLLEQEGSYEVSVVIKNKEAQSTLFTKIFVDSLFGCPNNPWFISFRFNMCSLTLIIGLSFLTCMGVTTCRPSSPFYIKRLLIERNKYLAAKNLDQMKKKQQLQNQVNESDTQLTENDNDISN